MTNISGEISNDEEIGAQENPKASTIYYSNTSGGAHGVYVKGDFAYVADTIWGL